MRWGVLRGGAGAGAGGRGVVILSAFFSGDYGNFKLMPRPKQLNLAMYPHLHKQWSSCPSGRSVLLCDPLVGVVLTGCAGCVVVAILSG